MKNIFHFENISLIKTSVTAQYSSFCIGTPNAAIYYKSNKN